MSALNPEKLSPQTSSLKDLHSKQLPPSAESVPYCPSGGQYGTISSHIDLLETKNASPPPAISSHIALPEGQYGTKSSHIALQKGNMGRIWPEEGNMGRIRAVPWCPPLLLTFFGEK